MEDSKRTELWNILKKYNRSIIVKYPPNLNCTACGNLIIDAYQAKCGCNFCKRCIETKRSDKMLCPGVGKYCKNTIISHLSNLNQDHKTNIEIAVLISKCPNDRCDFLDELNKLPDHLKECPRAPVTCPFARVGCTTINLTNSTIDGHLLSDSQLHSTKMIDYITKMEESKSRFESEFVKNKMTFGKMEIKVTSLTSTVAEQKNTINNLEQMLGNAHLEIKELANVTTMLMSVLDIVKSDVTGLTLALAECRRSTIEGFSQIRDQDKKKEISVKKMTEKQNKDMMTLKQEITNIVKLKHEVDTSLKKFETKSQSISEELLRLNYGEFIWAIDHFSEKKKLAQNGTNDEIESSPFYSHKNGYKMKLKCFPNGANTLKGKYVFIFFSILKGEYDDVLKWPFMDRIILSIVNQESGEIYHKVEYSYLTIAEEDRDVFNQQKTDKVGFGTMNFAKIDSLMSERNVLRNDTLFIRCTIQSEY